MFRALSRRPRRSLGPLSVLLALVALAMQIAAASIVPGAAPAASIDRMVAASICHSDGATGDQGGAPAPRHAPDGAICPICQAIAHAGVLLATPTAALVLPARSAFRSFVVQPARAPPSLARSATSARGPPAPL
jgi:hypothetical protein